METNATLAASLMRKAAEFFRSLGQGNPDVRDQMLEHADVFEAVANLVEHDPLGKAPTDHAID